MNAEVAEEQRLKPSTMRLMPFFRRAAWSIDVDLCSSAISAFIFQNPFRRDVSRADAERRRAWISSYN
jgi:hypothetical protein